MLQRSNHKHVMNFIKHNKSTRSKVPKGNSTSIALTGPDEPVRQLRFWLDLYYKLQQYIFQLKPKIECLQNVETWQVFALHTQGDKMPFRRLLMLISVKIELITQ